MISCSSRIHNKHLNLPTPDKLKLFPHWMKLKSHVYLILKCTFIYTFFISIEFLVFQTPKLYYIFPNKIAHLTVVGNVKIAHTIIVIYCTALKLLYFYLWFSINFLLTKHGVCTNKSNDNIMLFRRCCVTVYVFMFVLGNLLNWEITKAN